MNKLIPIALVVVTWTWASCKPKAEEGSSVASLDNMTRDSGSAISTNFCGIKLSKATAAHLSAKDKKVIASRIEAKDDALRYAAAGALAAVPKIMQQIFFATPHGKIQVVSDVRAKCAQGAPSAAEERFFAEGKKSGNAYALDGCWSAEGDNLMIYVKDDAAAIHHGLLRIFASAYAEFFTKRLEAVRDQLPAASKNDMNRRVERFKRQKHKLAQALLQDLDPKKSEAYEELRHDDPEGFATQVFAESIDSAYCSTASAHVMETKFPHVAAVVNEGPDALTKDFGEPAQ